MKLFKIKNKKTKQKKQETKSKKRVGIRPAKQRKIKVREQEHENKGEVRLSKSPYNSYEVLEAYLRKVSIPAEAKTFEELGITDAEGNQTPLGSILSDQCSHTIKFAVFEGKDKLLFKDRKVLTGSVLKQLEDAYKMIELYNSKVATFDGMNRSDYSNYPNVAVREALINAVAHRDYSYSGSIGVNIFSDRMEISSLGELPGELTLEAVLLGVSEPRNLKLTQILNEFNLMESFGTGLDKISSSYGIGIVKPEFKVEGPVFLVTLPNREYHKVNAKHNTKGNTTRVGSEKIISVEESNQSIHKITKQKNEKHKIVMGLLNDKEEISRSEIQEALNVGTTYSITIIKEFLEEGIISKIGSGKNTKYIKA